jgi:CheY-like chemotaxis protein/HPt (histidine-containing phosphotransfer) domain-containing protein
VYQYSSEELIQGVLYIFEDLGLTEQFSIDRTKLTNFLVQIKNCYKSNPYHNFTHAVDVLQFVYATLKIDRIYSFFSMLDILALIVAAIVHDLEHPGLNNNYQVNARTDLALLYNDLSVLENYHCARAFQIMMEEQYNFLSQLSADDYKELRKSIISLVLATDMSQHFELLTKFQTRISTGQLSKESKDDKQQFMNMILKAADISNVVRPFDVAKKWAEVLIEEFCAQGDMEKKQNMPISPLMDRDNLDKTKMQINFMDYIAGPLFKTIGEYITDFKVLHHNMLHNREIWSKGMGESMEATAKQPVSTGTQSVSAGKTPVQHPVSSVGQPTKAVYGELTADQAAKIKGFSVIVIENDKESRDAIEEVLSSTGFTCKECDSAEQGYTELEKGSFDIMILSCNLPNNSAFTMTKKIRSAGGHIRSIPIIGLLTSDNKETNEQRAKEVGINLCLTKPVHVAELLRAVEQLLELALKNCPVVDMNLAMELCGSEEDFVVELLGDFVTNGKEQLQLIQDSIKNGDYPTLQLNSHSMKGGAAQLAAKPIAQAAFVLEKAAKAHKPKEEMIEPLKILELRFKEVEDFVQNLQQ